MNLVNIRKLIKNKITTNGINIKNITDDTELLKNGYLDSMDIVEIMVILEGQKKKPLNFEYDDTNEEINISWFYKISNLIS